jgi:hypothetical protein
MSPHKKLHGKMIQTRRSSMTKIDLVVIESRAIVPHDGRKSATSLLLRYGLLFFCTSFLASAQTPAKQLPATGQVLHAQTSGLPVDVLVQGPADTRTELQIICLFRSEPSNTLHGSLIEMNQKLQGLLDVIRTPSLFAGESGETLLIVPKSGTLPARKLLIIGLGDSTSFTPSVMNLVGTIAFNESSRLGIKHPFFAPTVLDGGVSGFNTGEIAEQFMRGFLRARDLENRLQSVKEGPATAVQRLTFLAGAAHATDTQSGIAKAFTRE